MCLTYNQERYIQQCLDSLVCQKTNFKYQVVVHDDASTDSTTQILLGYANRYPDIVVPVIEKENVYSKGLNFDSILAPLIKGRYVAFCEGDDWWLSDDKLQIQYDYMEQNGDCSLCVHDAKLFDDRQGAFTGNLPSSGQERDISIEEIIENGGWYLGTNTMLFKAEYYELPGCYQGWGVSDYPRAIYLGTQGRVHFLSGSMAAHRVNASGSWTIKMSENLESREIANKKVVDGLKSADLYTDFRYHQSFNKAEFMLLKQIAELHHDFAKLMLGELSSSFWHMGVSEITKSVARCVIPRKWMHRVKAIMRR